MTGMTDMMAAGRMLTVALTHRTVLAHSTIPVVTLTLDGPTAAQALQVAQAVEKLHGQLTLYIDPQRWGDDAAAKTALHQLLSSGHEIGFDGAALLRNGETAVTAVAAVPQLRDWLRRHESGLMISSCGFAQKRLAGPLRRALCQSVTSIRMVDGQINRQLIALDQLSSLPVTVQPLPSLTL